jgi:transposase-like protein
MAAPRVLKPEFRMSVAQRILKGEIVSLLSDKYKIKRGMLYRWRDLLRDQGEAGFGRPRGPRPCFSKISKVLAGTSIARIRR